MGLAISLVATVKEKVSYLLQQKDRDINHLYAHAFIKLKFATNLKIIYWKFSENEKNQQQILFFLLTIKEFS